MGHVSACEGFLPWVFWGYSPVLLRRPRGDRRLSTPAQGGEIEAFGETAAPGGDRRTPSNGTLALFTTSPVNAIAAWVVPWKSPWKEITSP